MVSFPDGFPRPPAYDAPQDLMKSRCVAGACAICLGAFVLLGANGALADIQPQSLASQWRFQLDRADSGVNEKWFNRELTDKITLPGILQAQGFGDEIIKLLQGFGAVHRPTKILRTRLTKTRHP